LVLDALPEAGKVLWLQMTYTNGTGKPAWTSGNPHPLAPPVEPKPATLAHRPRLNSRDPVFLKSTSQFKLTSSSGRELTYYQNIETRLTEATVAAGPAGSRVRLGIDKFAIGISLNKEAPEFTPAFKEAIGRQIKALAIDLVLDPKGNITAKKNDLTRIARVADVRDIVNAMGDDIQSSFDAVAIPQPGGMVQPGQTWQARRTLPVYVPGNTQTGVMNVTYTYRGQRQHNGKTVAVLALSGGLSSARPGSNLRGSINGTALIDPATGMVIHAAATANATLTIKYRGDAYESRGTLEVRMDRGPEVR
jgi:hypothetical protein